MCVCVCVCVHGRNQQQATWSEYLSAGFPIFICVAIILSERESILAEKMRYDDILKVSIHLVSLPLLLLYQRAAPAALPHPWGRQRWRGRAGVGAIRRGARAEVMLCAMEAATAFSSMWA